MNKKLTLKFAPGAFDDFDGTQEELDQLVKTIQEAVDSGEILRMSQEVDLDELATEDLELAETLKLMLENPNKRKLN